MTGNTALCGAVVAGDDEVDRRYLDIERQVVDLLGRHAPIASDLRLLTAILHINLHLERIGDMAEQVWFLVTGELTEFDRAPRVPTPAS